MLKSIYLRLQKKWFWHPKNRSELHRYWREPYDGCNQPEIRIKRAARSVFLVDVAEEYAALNSKILEIGCGAGRNLHFLFQAGFRNLTGIEISGKAIHLMKEVYRELTNLPIHNAPVEEIISDFKDNEFDVVFTLAVFEHIHTSSEWIFPEIVRITKNVLITIEDEHCVSWRHFPRNYKNVFEPLGLKQVEGINCAGIADFSDNFYARIFEKVS